MVYKSTRQLTVPREISLHTQMRSDMEALKIERIKQRNDSVEKYENGEFRNDENRASEKKMNQDLNVGFCFAKRQEVSRDYNLTGTCC